MANKTKQYGTTGRIRSLRQALLIAGTFALCWGCTGQFEDRTPGWTGKIDGLAPDLVLDGPEAYKPVSAAISDAGAIYVIDSGNYRVHEYSPTGDLMTEVGRSGEGVGEFPFLDDFSTFIHVGARQLVVVMPHAQRVNVWSLDDWSARSFRVNGYAMSSAFDGEFLHLHLGTATSPLEDNAVHVYTLTGELVGAYGERLRPEWDDADAIPRLRSRNDLALAATPSGRIYAAMAFWPSLRAFDRRELAWEGWYDMGWLEGEAISDIFDRPRELFEELVESDLDENVHLNAVLHLGVAAADDLVVTLMGGSYAQAYTPGGVHGKTYKLFRPDQDPNGSQRFGQTGRHPALSPDGHRLCVPETQEARVLCYTIPGGPEGALSSQ